MWHIIHFSIAGFAMVAERMPIHDLTVLTALAAHTACLVVSAVAHVIIAITATYHSIISYTLEVVAPVVVLIVVPGACFAALTLVLFREFVSVLTVNAHTLVAAITALHEAVSLLTFSAILGVSIRSVALAASVAVDFRSTPAVDAVINFVAGASATCWVALVADFAVGTAACACCVTLLTFSFRVEVLVPVAILSVAWS